MMKDELQAETAADSSTTDAQLPSALLAQNPVLAAVFVGQILYCERTGRYSNGEITEHTVTKIGRKYFECTGLNDKINVSNLMYESKMYSQNNYRLYRTKQEILDKNEVSRLYSKVQHSFSHYSNKKFTLEVLRKVAKIIGVSANGS